MTKYVIVLEDDPDVAHLVRELLEEDEYRVIHVTTTDELLRECAQRSPCVALVDSTNSKNFDLWWLGPRLSAMGVPPLAFTAHGSAQKEFEANGHGFAGIVPKPFDAESFLTIVNSICWTNSEAAAS